ncbi:MAG: ABC transporter permease [Candidatus Micrarchaeia archaeon]
MPLLSDTYALFKREMLIFRSNLRTNIIRSMIFPLVLILFFGNLGSTTHGVNVAIVNYANNQQSHSLINALSSQRTLSIVGITSQTNALSMLQRESVDAVIVILPSFPSASGGAPSVDVYYSDSDAQAVRAILPFIQTQAQAYGGSVGAHINAPTGSISDPHSNPASLIPLYGTNSNYKVFLVGGIIAMVAAFGTVFGGGISIITDRQLGNLKSFLLAPINKLSIIMSKILSGTLQSMLYVVVAVVIGLLDGATIAMGPLGLLWILLIAGMISLGFSGVTTILASRINKVEVYSIVANVIVLPMWFLSGAFFPASSLPSFMRPLSTYNPMTYATQAVRDVMILGYFPANAILIDMSALLAFLAFGIVASILLFKTHID